ncbi:MAG: TetR/AcrR family transcriptional regulator [Sphingomonadales bacterium]|nr:TetR/AcrR family transcriptional regulator [Sphingomonadales bacterium]
MAQALRQTESAPGRRGRPSAQRVAAIDAAIRAAALELFMEVGFDAASMDAIAAAAPVSKGTLYARYESKELLFHAVLEEEFERWSRRAGAEDHLLTNELGPRLRHHARVLIGVFGWPEYRRFARLVESTKLTFPELARVWQEVGTSRYIAFLAADMAQTEDGRGASAADREFLANLFLHAISGWYLMEAACRTVAEDEAQGFADRVIQSILTLIQAMPRNG